MRNTKYKIVIYIITIFVTIFTLIAIFTFRQIKILNNPSSSNMVKKPDEIKKTQEIKEEIQTESGKTLKIKQIDNVNVTSNTPYKNLNVFEKLIVEENNIEKELEVSDLLTQTQQHLLKQNNEVQYYGYFSILGENIEENAMWLALDIHSSADPPVSQNFSIIYLNLENLNTKIYALDIEGWYYPTFDSNQFNTKKNNLVFDEVDSNGNVSLIIFMPLSGEKIKLKSYPSEQIGYNSREYKFLEYLYSEAVFSTYNIKDDTKKLDPKWSGDNAIEYNDLHTGQELKIQL